MVISLGLFYLPGREIFPLLVLMTFFPPGDASPSRSHTGTLCAFELL